MHVVSNDSAGFAEILARTRSVMEPKGASVTIGVFDGVHRGHRQLVSSLVDGARSSGSVATAITFVPHPTATMTEEKAPSAGQRIRQSDPVVERLRLLTTVEERAELLSTLGIDVLIILPFGRPLAETQADRFIELLLEHLHMTGLWAGPNFALGHRREGNVPYLQRVGKERGFAVHVVEPLVWNGEAVSSSRVRAALERGDVDEATGCLGRPYRVAGIVARGDERGRRIGFPTANLSPPRERLIPSGGIYACLAHAGSETYPAAVSIGVRPTFPGVGDVTGPVLEAHLLDFCGDLYGRMLALDFFARLRDEWAFPSAAALAAQIREDVARVREILAGRRYCNPEISKE